MLNVDLLTANLLSPAVICFVVGALAAWLKSDLRVPPQVHETISMYLLFSIGLKGGIALSTSAGTALLPPVLITIALGIVTPLLAFAIARWVGRLSVTDSGAMAAHFGSVSAVTFMAALNFATLNGVDFEGFMTALLIVLEIPGIVLALVLTRMMASDNRTIPISHIVREAFTGKSVVLMLGGLLVGLVANARGIEAVSTVFITPFHGVLTFFLLEMGVVAATKLREANAPLLFMLLFGTLVPLLFGAIGLGAGMVAGLSAGGMAILATMAASASYIAAPAAVKMALPEANEGLYLTTSISITLPFNLAIGIPLYFYMASLANG